MLIGSKGSCPALVGRILLERRVRSCCDGSALIEVVCAVIRCGKRHLLCLRPEGSHLAGSWEFPGGKVEDGEGPREALRREIREELGCDVRVEGELPVVEHHYPDLSIRLQPFLCSLQQGEPAALEHAEIAWFEAQDVEALGLAEADREVWGGYRRMEIGD